MKTIHYLIIIRSHLVTIAAMAPFTLKSTSKLRFALSALHFRYSKVIPRVFPALIRLNPNNHYTTTVFITFFTTTTMFMMTI